MKTFLMYRDRDFGTEPVFPFNDKELSSDLELDVLFSAMAVGDPFIYDVVRKTILCSGDNCIDTILYRQEILKDCIANPRTVRELYSLPVELVENKRKKWYVIFTSTPGSVLASSIESLEMSVMLLKKLKHIIETHNVGFKSEGFARFSRMILNELNGTYFHEIDTHLKNLRFTGGVLLSAELGKGNEGYNYTLCKQIKEKRFSIKRIFTGRRKVYSFKLHPRDEAGQRKLSELRDRAINNTANSLARSVDHIEDFFRQLRFELAFYLGCLNLHEKLDSMGEPLSYPDPLPRDENSCSFRNLYEVCLALTKNESIIGNDLDARGKSLFVITGANQGGKSTLLRSIGLVQIMMQCGMFVPAESFSAGVCAGIFTHFRKEEDGGMKSGKLDEELGRMSLIIDKIKEGSLLLLNESFAATNEREGSEIARHIVTALHEKGVRIFFVTHLYEFAGSLKKRGTTGTLFLRAERGENGRRSYKIIEGEPLATAFGEDLYRDIFAEDHSEIII